MSEIPTKKSKPFQLPKSLRELPRIDVTSVTSSSAEQSTRRDVVYGVKSQADAIREGIKRLGSSSLKKLID
jgi:hypothetical protein